MADGDISIRIDRDGEDRWLPRVAAAATVIGTAVAVVAIFF